VGGGEEDEVVGAIAVDFSVREEGVACDEQGRVV
jgi:hypothetical protein